MRRIFPIAVIILVLGLAAWSLVWAAQNAPKDPWTHVGGGMKYQCQGTTAIYQQGNNPKSNSAAPGDPRCAGGTR